MARPSSLQLPAEELVLAALRENQQPLSAIGILEKVKCHGINSTPIVYRALEILFKNGSVHRINKLNSFIACNCDEDHQHELSILTVCQDCDQVEELHDHSIIHHLSKLRSLGLNLVNKAIVELPIVCGKCLASEANI